jgi:HNH endonuclease
MTTQARLQQLFEYEDGVLRWRKDLRLRGIQAGKRAGCKYGDGNTYYLLVTVDQVQYMAHRLIWLLVYGKWPDNQIDHIDGNGLNNKLSNLRDVTCAVNLRNR